jgi:hypothetical protein
METDGAEEPDPAADPPWMKIGTAPDSLNFFQIPLNGSGLKNPVLPWSTASTGEAASGWEWTEQPVPNRTRFRHQCRRAIKRSRNINRKWTQIDAVPAFDSPIGAMMALRLRSFASICVHLRLILLKNTQNDRGSQS